MLIRDAGNKINELMAGEADRYFELLQENDPKKYICLVKNPLFQENWHNKKDLGLLKKDIALWISEWKWVIDRYKVKVAA